MRATVSMTRLGLWACVVLGTCGVGPAMAVTPPVEEHGPSSPGAELFMRVWEPGDARSQGGDGLGPVYNERSCVACHSLGAPGGAGPTDKNVDILTITWSDKLPPRPLKDLAADFHVGFLNSDSLVYHRFGTDPDHKSWSSHPLSREVTRLPGNRGEPTVVGSGFGTIAEKSSYTIRRSQRNTPALFGAGLIDAIPDEVLIDAAAHKDPITTRFFPRVKGRVGTAADGKVGRFGWKGQLATLDEFVRTACASEMGLEVPGHPQARAPHAKDDVATGLDMTDEECADLVAYVRHLPAPIQLLPSDSEDRRVLANGQSSFVAIGCAACHRPSLGSVEGIYSDLLLHDMGRSLADLGSSYGISTSKLSELADGANEWRTPPLWGLRDSGPYLHDGRAETLDEAILLHGGEGAGAAKRYANLGPKARSRLIAFLNTLAAPKPVARLARH